MITVKGIFKRISTSILDKEVTKLGPLVYPCTVCGNPTKPKNHVYTLLWNLALNLFMLYNLASFLHSFATISTLSLTTSFSSSLVLRLNMVKSKKFRGVRQRHWGSWVSEIRHPLLYILFTTHLAKKFHLSSYFISDSMLHNVKLHRWIFFKSRINLTM